jgi:hypothetical protein
MTEEFLKDCSEMKMLAADLNVARQFQGDYGHVMMGTPKCVEGPALRQLTYPSPPAPCCNLTLQEAGCAITCFAMITTSFGSPQTPITINNKFVEMGNFALCQLRYWSCGCALLALLYVHCNNAPLLILNRARVDDYFGVTRSDTDWSTPSYADACAMIKGGALLIGSVTPGSEHYAVVYGCPMNDTYTVADPGMRSLPSSLFAIALICGDLIVQAIAA